MKLLKKYHPQNISKIKLKKYQKLNQEYQLGYSLKNDYGILMLSVFEKALQNKTQVEKLYERIRNEHFDMWDNLMNTERNILLDQGMDPLRASLSQFTWGTHQIIIPFFDTLLNNLYYKETAILELPQFHRLYTDFTKQIQPIENYETMALKSDMSFAKMIIEDDEHLILYSNELNTFYKVNQKNVVRYPLDQVMDSDILVIATSILYESEEELYRLLYQRGCMSPKAMKKIGKKLSK